MSKKKESIVLKIIFFISLMLFLVPLLWPLTSETTAPVVQHTENSVTVEPANHSVVAEPEPSPVVEMETVVQPTALANSEPNANAVSEAKVALVESTDANVIDNYLDELEGAANTQQSDKANAINTQVADSGAPPLSDDYEFPEVQPDGDGGYFVNPNTDGSFPSEPGTRLLEGSAETEFNDEDGGTYITPGDVVSIRWNMFSWRTGELVDSSDTIAGGAAVKTVVVDLDDANFQPPYVPAAVRVPEYLVEALIGRQVGDRLQVIFEYDMEDLPDTFSQDDAYILVVDIVGKDD